MEYESRRDADDAYHEMHNKRIDRDLLKIEVSPFYTIFPCKILISAVGSYAPFCLLAL